MPVTPEQLLHTARQALAGFELTAQAALGEVTLVVAADSALSVFERLRDADGLQFDTLIDVCGVDYSTFGHSEWDTDGVTDEGFSRGRIDEAPTSSSLNSMAQDSPTPTTSTTSVLCHGRTRTLCSCHSTSG